MDQERWRKVQGLFHAALGLEAEARQGFLDVECGGDIDLQRQVELLLANEEEAGGFLETPAARYATVKQPITVPLLGRQFGPYRIVCPLGSGGMGEVYRAHDSKLARDVAIKTLPPEFARDPERLVRFRREARTLASLNHPNIAAIYGLEESGDVDCLVLELVEGDTLHGPLPIERALDYARQVAEGLEAAHEKGIIHRDLKPANVKVTLKGRVKILDFGLAKAILGPEGNQDLSQAARMTDDETLAGHILGTPGYMSPEQTRGQAVDARTDIWAFGCLFFELLTGKRAFHGESHQETAALVLEIEPDWRALPAKTPTRIRDLLRQCLQKDAGHRLSSIAHARRAIEQTQARSNRWLAGAAATLVALAIAAAMWFHNRSAISDRSQWAQLTRFPDSVSQPALSPDGRMLAFLRSESTFFGPGQLYVKILPDGEPVQRTHDNLSKMSPAFSPDGTRIAYTTVDPEFHWDTWVVPVVGGEPHLLLRNASGLVWTGPQQMLFSEIRMGVHMAVVAAQESRVGQRDVYVPPNEPDMAHRSYPSPGGKWVLLVEMDDDHRWLPCRVVPLDGSSPGRQVGPPGGGCTFGAWSPDAKWIYLTSNAVGANHIWRERYPDGTPEQITSGPTQEEGIAMAPDGRSFVTAVALQNTSLWAHDSHGDRQVSLEANAADPKFTPDGKRVLFRTVKEAPNQFDWFKDPGELHVADLESGRSEPLIPGLQVLSYDLSFDGRQVVMETADPEGKPQLWLAPSDRSAPPARIPNAAGGQPKFGPDGEIFFRRSEGSSIAKGTLGFIYRIRPDGAGIRKALAQPVLLFNAVSPDGNWISAWAPLPGNGPAAHQAFPLEGGPPVRIGSALFLRWSRDGRSAYLTEGAAAGTKAYVISLKPGHALPQLPAGGFHSDEELAHFPGAHKIDATGVQPGPSPEVYAYYRGAAQRNLYRIPIP
jgi:serine/threonine protein kinase